MHFRWKSLCQHVLTYKTNQAVRTQLALRKRDPVTYSYHCASANVALHSTRFVLTDGVCKRWRCVHADRDQMVSECGRRNWPK